MLQTVKWTETIKISWSNMLAYRLNFLFQVIGPALVFFFVKYNLWSAIYSTAKSNSIQGYDLDTMLQYHFWVLIIALLAQTSNSINISEDIRLGRISSYLIYPFEFWKFHTAGFIAHTGLQVITSSITFLLFFSFGFAGEIQIMAILKGLVLTFTVAYLWFLMQYIFGLMAFWFEETWVFRVIFLTTSAFFSGAIIPLEIFPSWLSAALKWTPFPYMTFIPAKIFMGSDISLFYSVLPVFFWIIIAWLLGTYLWKLGLKHYTAAGM